MPSAVSTGPVPARGSCSGSPEPLGRALTGFDGRWATGDTLIVTGIAVERGTPTDERTTVERESDA